MRSLGTAALGQPPATASVGDPLPPERQTLSSWPRGSCSWACSLNADGAGELERGLENELCKSGRLTSEAVGSQAREVGASPGSRLRPDPS